MIEKYRLILKNSPLFKDIDEERYSDVLRLLDNKIRSYDKGETIIRFGDRIQSAGIVIEGSVEGTFFNEGYNEISMSRFTKGMIFGEALASLNTNNSPMEVKALEKTMVLFLKLSKLQDVSADPNLARTLYKNLVFLLAQKNAFLNLKVRILSQKSLKDKIIMYISSLPEDCDGYHTIPFNKTSLASFLNANRSALERELSKMVNDHIVTINRRKIKIH